MQYGEEFDLCKNIPNCPCRATVNANGGQLFYDEIESLSGLLKNILCGCRLDEERVAELRRVGLTWIRDIVQPVNEGWITFPFSDPQWMVSDEVSNDESRLKDAIRELAQKVHERFEIRISVAEAHEEPEMPLPTLPAAATGDDLLSRLDRAVRERVERGESALQIALSDDLVSDMDDWYCQSLQLLRDRIERRRNLESIDGLLKKTSYASKILWFRTAFEDSRFGGGNAHARGFRESLGGGDNFYDPLRKFGLLKPFPFDESPFRPDAAHGFSDYVWFMSGAGVQGGAGRASALTLGLKELCRDGDTEYATISALYEKPDDIWHIGLDLQRFVDTVRNRTIGNADESWMRSIHAVFNAAFPAFNDVDVSCAQFLDYDTDGALTPSVILGFWGARFNNGYDRISCNRTEVIERDWLVDGCYKIPIGERRVGTSLCVQGLGCDKPPRDLANMTIADISGVYARATETRYGKNGQRRNWWRKIEDKGWVRFNHTLLLCQAGETERPDIPNEATRHFRIGGVSIHSVCCNGGVKKFTFAVLTPQQGCEVATPLKLGGITFALRPRPLAISVMNDAEPLISEHDEVICSCDDVLELSGSRTGEIEMEWFVNGQSVAHGCSLPVNAVEVAFSIPFEVECRIGSRRVGRSVRVVKLPPGVVGELKSSPAETCPHDWRIDVEESLSYATKGEELCRVTRVNEAGVPITEAVLVRRPCRGVCWWIEKDGDTGLLRMPLRTAVGGDIRLVRADLPNYSLAVPVRYLDRGLRCDDKVSVLQPDDWQNPEGGRWRGLYKRVPLAKIVQRAGNDEVYRFGEVQSQRTIGFDAFSVARFDDIPCSVCASTHAGTGHMGVYFPNGAASDSVKLAIFTDNVTIAGFDTDKPLMEKVVKREDAVESDQEGCFVSLDQTLSEVADSTGELWGVLSDNITKVLGRNDLISSCSCFMLGSAVTEAFLPQNAGGLASYRFLRLVGNLKLKDVGESLPYYRSRVARYARQYAAALESDAWWFEMDNQAERMNLCQCRDLANEEIEGARLCLTAKAMAGEFGRALSSLRADAMSTDDQLVTRVAVAEIIRVLKGRGERYRFDGSGIERAIFQFKSEERETTVFSYDPSSQGPVLCLRGNDWGVYVPGACEIQPMIRVYTDNPESAYFEDGLQLVDVSLGRGFNPLQDGINSVLREDGSGELYLALFHEQGIDPRFSAGQFLDVDMCQIVCVATRHAEWYSLSGPQVNLLLEMANRVGDALGQYCPVGEHTWGRSRLLELYRVRQDAPINSWISSADIRADLLSDRMLDNGVVAPGRCRSFFRFLLETGFNFLAEANFFLHVYGELRYKMLSEWLRSYDNDVFVGLRDSERRALFSHPRDQEGERIFQLINRVRPDFPEDLETERYELESRLKSVFRDLSIDEEADANGDGLCSAVVINEDLNRNNRGNCKEMEYKQGSERGFNISVVSLGVLRGVQGDRYSFATGSRPVNTHLEFRNLDSWYGFSVCKQNQANSEGSRFADDDWTDLLRRGHGELSNVLLRCLQTGVERHALTPFVEEMFKAWVEAIGASRSSGVYRTLTLTGLLMAVNLEVTMAGVPDDWILRRNAAAYDLCLRVVYTSFVYRHFCSDAHRWQAWRCLMRAMGSAMGILHRPDRK